MIKYSMNKHSEPLSKKSNFPPPGSDKFFELLHYTPKNISIVLTSRGERNTDFVSFVTILPIFAAKRPDYIKYLACCYTDTVVIVAGLNRIMLLLFSIMVNYISPTHLGSYCQWISDTKYVTVYDAERILICNQKFALRFDFTGLGSKMDYD